MVWSFRPKCCYCLYSYLQQDKWLLIIDMLYMYLLLYLSFIQAILLVINNFFNSKVFESIATLIILTRNEMCFCSLSFFFFLNTHTAITPTGLRSSALLALMLSNESASESELCPVSPDYSQEISTATDASSLPGSTAAICSPSSPKYKVRKIRGLNHNETAQY